MNRGPLITCSALLLAAFAVPAVAQLDFFSNDLATGSGPKVEARAVLDVTAITPGKPFTLAISLKMNPGWHIYWSNPGESGIATSFALTLPPGFKAAPAQFPLPHTFVVPGDVTCYGHQDTSIFLVTITPPAALPPTLPPLKVKANWLNCTKEECVPGDAELTLPLVAGGGEAAHERLFEAARDALPAPAAPPSLMKAPITPATSTSEGRITFRVPLPFRDKPAGVEAFPDFVEGLDVSAIKIETTEGNPTISLTARLLTGQHLKVDTLPLLVVYSDIDGKRRGFYQHLSLAPLRNPGPR